MLIKTKRVEIVIDVVHFPKLIAAVESSDISAYTILPEARGRGDRGRRNAQDPASVESNSFLMMALPEERLDSLLAAVKPLLERYGGLCLVSDALLLQH